MGHPTGEGELLPHWNPIVLLQARPGKTQATWNGTRTTEREKVGSWSGVSCPLVHLLMP